MEIACVKKMLHWSPLAKLDQALRKTIEWIRSITGA